MKRLGCTLAFFSFFLLGILATFVVLVLLAELSMWLFAASVNDISFYVAGFGLLIAAWLASGLYLDE